MLGFCSRDIPTQKIILNKSQLLLAYIASIRMLVNATILAKEVLNIFERIYNSVMPKNHSTDTD